MLVTFLCSYNETKKLKLFILKYEYSKDSWIIE